MLALARPLLALGAFFQLVDAVGIVAAGSLRGAGDTRWPFVIQATLAWALRLPLVYVCAFVLDGGVFGAWAGELGAHCRARACADAEVPKRPVEDRADLTGIGDGLTAKSPRNAKQIEPKVELGVSGVCGGFNLRTVALSVPEFLRWHRSQVGPERLLLGVVHRGESGRSA